MHTLATLVTQTTKNAHLFVDLKQWGKNTQYHWSFRRSECHNPRSGLLRLNEAQINLRKIVTNDTKYYYVHVLSALDQTTATWVLSETFGLSRQERASHLLHFWPLGDSKPSALKDKMLALLGDHRPCLLFEQLFPEQLPEDKWIQLVDVEFCDHWQLVQKADALWSATNSVQQKQPPTSKQIPPGTSNLCSIHVDGSTSAIQQCPQPTQKVKIRHPTAANICYYHSTFGKLAHWCQKPCAWSRNEQAGCQ